MTQAPMLRPQQIDRMREKMAEVGRSLDYFDDVLRETNNDVIHGYFTPLIARLRHIVANERAGYVLALADDLANARSALRRLPLEDIDPDFGAPTPALRAVRGGRGNVVEALDNALEASAALGLRPRETDLSGSVVAVYVDSRCRRATRPA